MKKVIVLGHDHTNSLGIVQCLGTAGYTMLAFVWGTKTGLIKMSRFISKIYTASTPQDCIEKIINLDSEGNERIPIIASCDAAALLLDKNRERLSEKFIFEYATKASFRELFEKDTQVKIATEAGFYVPKSQIIEDLKTINNTIGYPCLIKPLVSCQGAKSDIRICRNERQLRENITTLEYTKRIIIQQYIERDYEISILGCGLRNGETVIPCVENKLTLFPKYVGLECLANLQPLTDEAIINPIKRLIKDIGYVGLFSVEMMHNREDNKFYFTEINLRNDGANSFVYKYGTNLPLIHVEDLCNAPFTLFKDEIPGFYIWEMHHLSSLLHKDITLRQWIKDLYKSKGFLLTIANDWFPFFWQFISPILRKIHLFPSGNY